MNVDVAIIGGGPAGSTCATLLLKYNPRLKVAVFERERFPRDHVGESQLPYISQILDEMGVWDKVERANFPIKIGATYRWGTVDGLWDFEFVPNGEFGTQARPAEFEGQRRKTAFQVDRAIYDKILLDHARGQGAKVYEETAVRTVQQQGDRVMSLTLSTGEEVTARHYVDASGHAGLIRRAMGVEVDCPTQLQNIAIWDYWQNADWAVSIGIGGTRVQVLSLGYGWIWFIPLGPTRTSIGLILPAATYKASGKRPPELYEEALCGDPIINRLIKNAQPEGKLATTKDWSFVADRLAGENWFLAGESAGFADPILAAGMTLAHAQGRDVAYTIHALDRGDYEPDWLRSRYDQSHRTKIRQHIRFADFWYCANGCFTDLKDFTQVIARDAGLDLDPDKAWQWLGTGGFVDESTDSAGVAGYNLTAVKYMSASFLGGQAKWELVGFNRFTPDLEGAERTWVATLENGRITRHRCYHREGRRLPTFGAYGIILASLKEDPSINHLIERVVEIGTAQNMNQAQYDSLHGRVIEALEAMVAEGWVIPSLDPSQEAVGEANIDHDAWFHRSLA